MPAIGLVFIAVLASGCRPAAEPPPAPAEPGPGGQTALVTSAPGGTEGVGGRPANHTRTASDSLASDGRGQTPADDPASGDPAAPDDPANGAASRDVTAAGPWTLPYDLDRPAGSFRLSKKLQEVSGLGLVDDSTVAAVQDELGVLFFLRIEDGSIRRTVLFADRGDYEGVERVRDTLYVLRSDGDLYLVQDWETDSPQAEKLETRLKSKNDTEGLGYDPRTGHLLIAAKEDPGDVSDRMRAVFSFDPARRTVEKEPALLIDTRSLNDGDGAVSKAVRTLLPKVSRFKPAGVAVHPRTGFIYVVSSVRQVLAVFDRSGNLVGMGDLKQAGLSQPEGITFLPSGDLLVASEGSSRGRLVRFTYLPDDTP